MKLILNGLKQHSIISSQYIQTLRHSLKEEHPDFTTLQQAQLFAQALHRLLDDELAPFDQHLQKHLKYTLLKKTIHKEYFSIDAGDILSAYTQLEQTEHAHIASLTEWINHYQKSPLSFEEVYALVDYMKQETESKVTPSTTKNTKKKSNFLRLGYLLLTTILLISAYFYKMIYLPDVTNTSQTYLADIQIESPVPVEPEIKLEVPDHSMQPTLQYQEFDQEALRNWLEQRNSLLASEPYFSTIIETAKDFNIHPLLLFSITGQEQNFVPKVHEHAEEIANNPFNLYGSWKIYNTSIEESSQIVSRTLINLGKGCPENEDQIKWINKAYAEDPNWHLGVTYFFNELQAVTDLFDDSSH